MVKKTKTYLQSTNSPDLRFEILAYDEATGVAELEGPYATFKEALSVERMKKIGYKITKEV